MTAIALAKQVTVAIAGQPNTGKSTVFNGLTRKYQRVGNWPGKTVEKKSGKYVRNGCEYHVTDLPGTYTMVARTPEEAIARDFVIEKKTDATIVVMSAAALERGLCFVSEILSLPTRVVVALNMMDIAEKHGIRIDTERLEEALNVKVVPMVASKQEGLEELKQALEEVTSAADYAPNAPSIEPELDALAVASRRYAWVSQVVSGVAQEPKEELAKTRAQRFDKYAVHPVSGTLILIGVFLRDSHSHRGLPWSLLWFRGSWHAADDAGAHGANDDCRTPRTSSVGNHSGLGGRPDYYRNTWRSGNHAGLPWLSTGVLCHLGCLG
jgi:Fe2+ transport system protein B